MASIVTTLRKVRALPVVNRPLTTIVRLLLGRARPEIVVSHLPRSGVVEVQLESGVARFWSRGDDFITSRVWWRGLDGFEPETVRPFLALARTARTVVDIGAYTGYYAILAAAVNPSARVFAFEPHPALAARLGRNLSLNPEVTVVSLPYAVGRHRGPAAFHVGGPYLPSSSSLDDAWAGLWESIPTAVTDLESFADDWGVETIDLLKIDVEGAEDGVLAGMGRLLDAKPAIFLEILDDDAARRVQEILEPRGYAFFSLRPGVLARIPRLTADGAWRNYLACPPDRAPAPE